METRRIDRKLHSELTVCCRVMEFDESTAQHSVLRSARGICQTLALFGDESGDVDQADNVIRLRRGICHARATVGVADGNQHNGPSAGGAGRLRHERTLS